MRQHLCLLHGLRWEVWSQFPHVLGSFALNAKLQVLWLEAQVGENDLALHVKPCCQPKINKMESDIG